MNRNAFGLWPTVALLAGAVLVFAGERLLGGTGRLVADGGGALLLLAALVLRLLAWQRATDGHRGAQAKLLLTTLLTLGGLGLYGLATDAALGALGGTPGGDGQVVLQRLWPVLFSLGLIPLVLLEAAYAPMRRAVVVEAARLSQALAGGVSLACAIAFLFVTYHLADTHDVSADFSYFRTAQAGEATQGMVARLEGDLEVHLFFPRANEVLEEVREYLAPLVQASPRLKVTEQDRFLEPELAREYGVRKDGTMVLVSGERHETLAIGDELKKARSALKKLDQSFAERFGKVTAPARRAYRTVGHGEAGSGGEGTAGIKGLESLLKIAGYTIKPLGLKEGLARAVPDDAALVLVIAPREPFLPEEAAALAAYATGGGDLLLALDPERPVGLDAALAALGLTYDGTRLANDQIHLRRQHTPADRALLATDRFVSHPAVKSLVAARRMPVVLLESGSLGKLETAPKTLKVRFPLRAMTGTWAETNGNFDFDAPAEQKGAFNLLAVVSRDRPATVVGPEAPAVADDGAAGDASPGSPATSREMRSVVLADGDALTDVVLSHPPNLYLASDVVRWLGGVEGVTGTVTSEEDVPVQHTREQDQLWFYGTVFAMPALVFGGGLGFNRWRRRRRAGR